MILLAITLTIERAIVQRIKKSKTVPTAKMRLRIYDWIPKMI